MTEQATDDRAKPRIPTRARRAGRRMVRSGRRAYARAKHVLGTFEYRGWGRSCPVCGRSSRRFMPHGSPPRSEARCVHCGSLERHRLAWLHMREQTDMFDGRPKKVLHFAPERCLEPRLRRALDGSYTTADLMRSDVDETVDVTDIAFPDGSFDVILCSHVLEHVPDDGKAMTELARVLSPGGWMILMVPIRVGPTKEDPTIVEPAERTKAFGQFDHVRIYGDDLVDRLGAAGLAVTTIRPAGLLSPADVERFGLRGDLFHVERSAS